MFFKRQRTVPTGYAASNFLLTCFIVGLLILSLAFVYYTRLLLQHSEVFKRQVEPLAKLTALLPSVNDGQLQNQLSQIIEELLTESRLSFIITDPDDGQVKIAKNLSDKTIEDKMTKITAGIPLSDAEENRLNAIRNRMKRKNEPIPLHNFLPDGYLYHGVVAANAIDQLPYVITDLEHNPQQWKIWDKFLTPETATPEQYKRAEMFVHNSKVAGRYVLLQTNPGLQGHLYHEVVPDYGIFVMPIVLVAVFSTVSILGFLSYRRIKTVEQASIWGGLAKETAHQLGTPISSLMGWVELSMELDKQRGDHTTAEIYANMQSDLARLQRITERFGKIGSYPQQTPIDINSVIGDAVAYFQKRLPNLSKQVELRVVDRELPEIVANADLLQWVFENLIRNSLDAIDKENGIIQIDPRLHPKEHQIVILYKDNGHGIPRENRNKIFRPGMTTKKHGWGLGLTLVRRIIEAYHHGQIRLIHTSSEGTTFEIVLPVETGGDERTAKLLTKTSLFWKKFREKKKGEQSGSAKYNA